MKSVALLLCLALCFSGVVAGGKRTLVVYDSVDVRSTHSTFFSQLEELGHKLTYATADADVAKLNQYGEYMYDNLVLFAPSETQLSSALTLESILQFIDDGNNVLVAADNDVGEATRAVAAECGIVLEDGAVYDHVNYDTKLDDGYHAVVAAKNVNKNSKITGNTEGPVLFRGIGQKFRNDEGLHFKIVSGSATTFSSVNGEAKEGSSSFGKNVVMVSALQARNNARVTVSGSLEMFSDRYFAAGVSSANGEKVAKSGNEALSKNIILWTFGGRGLLRQSNVHFHKEGESARPYELRIKDDIEFSLDVEEFDGEKWVPFAGKDMQVEFVMLDPYVRAFLVPNGKGKMAVSFKVPDHYGVFQFKINYFREGYGSLVVAEQITVRPFRHNEYERYIKSAYPYYASVFLLMSGFFVFSFFFIHTGEKAKAE